MMDLLPKKAAYDWTQAHTTRAMPVAEVAKLAASCGLKGNAYNDVTEALEAARRAAAPRDLIYVGGSMYVLAELLTAIGYDDHLDN